MIGDVPYGDAQVAAFPAWIDQINADAAVRSTFHVGDIKNGSAAVHDDYFQLIRATSTASRTRWSTRPGDNEWTDCHRANNGAYDPLERLATIRSVLRPTPTARWAQEPSRSRRRPRGFPENVTSAATASTSRGLHVVGSNNGRHPWTGLGNTVATAGAVAEEQARMANGIDGRARHLRRARQRHDRAVTVLLQADMFDPTYTPNFANDISAFQPLVQALVDESSAFDGEVYLVNGDSHVYNSDRPLAAGSRWLATYGVTGLGRQPRADHRRRLEQQHGLAAGDRQPAGSRPRPVVGAHPVHVLTADAPQG